MTPKCLSVPKLYILYKKILLIFITKFYFKAQSFNNYLETYKKTQQEKYNL